MIKHCYPLCLASLLSVLAGCSTQSSYPPSSQPQAAPKPTAPPPAVTYPQPGAVAPTPATPAVMINPAALSLARQGRGQYQQQDYQGAIATAERGLRIDRRAADLYLLLAESYLQLGQPDKARLFIQQGKRFATAGSEAAQGLQRLELMVQGY
uniref:tetratricopeptide repeat protein n=1 Tax=Cellvibrio fontiphilus TaxID=1815559 RepID=UPI002B4C1D16|nr:tetratricopeptide repeat protein [Cellvibrio fontiphilus]